LAAAAAGRLDPHRGGRVSGVAGPGHGRAALMGCVWS
jgi:hypothetical protein